MVLGLQIEKSRIVTGAVKNMIIECFDFVSLTRRSKERITQKIITKTLLLI